MDRMSTEAYIRHPVGPAWESPVLRAAQPASRLQECLFREAETILGVAMGQLNLAHFDGDVTICLPVSPFAQKRVQIWIDLVAEVTSISTDCLQIRRIPIIAKPGHELSKELNCHLPRDALRELGRAGYLEIQAFASDNDRKPDAPQSRARYLFINHAQVEYRLSISEADDDVIDLRKLTWESANALPFMHVCCRWPGGGLEPGMLEIFAPHGHIFAPVLSGQDAKVPLPVTAADVGRQCYVYFHTICPHHDNRLAGVSRCRKLRIVSGTSAA